MWKGYLLHDLNYIEFWKRQNYREWKDQWLPGALKGGRSDIKAEQQGCLGHWNYFLQYSSGGYMSTPTDYTTQKVNPKANCGL